LRRAKNNIEADPTMYANGIKQLVSFIRKYIEVTCKEELFGNLNKVDDLLSRNSKTILKSWSKRPLLPKSVVNPGKKSKRNLKFCKKRWFYLEEIDSLLDMYSQRKDIIKHREHAQNTFLEKCSIDGSRYLKKNPSRNNS
jgi:hypothetical protein